MTQALYHPAHPPSGDVGPLGTEVGNKYLFNFKLCNRQSVILKIWKKATSGSQGDNMITVLLDSQHDDVLQMSSEYFFSNSTIWNTTDQIDSSSSPSWIL